MCCVFSAPITDALRKTLKKRQVSLWKTYVLVPSTIYDPIGWRIVSVYGSLFGLSDVSLVLVGNENEGYVRSNRIYPQMTLHENHYGAIDQGIHVFMSRRAARLNSEKGTNRFMVPVSADIGDLIGAGIHKDAVFYKIKLNKQNLADGIRAVFQNNEYNTTQKDEQRFRKIVEQHWHKAKNQDQSEV